VCAILNRECVARRLESRELPGVVAVHRVCRADFLIACVASASVARVLSRWHRLSSRVCREPVVSPLLSLCVAAKSQSQESVASFVYKVVAAK
jgi:hypothetical protein